jgi:hypothetical protein
MLTLATPRSPNSLSPLHFSPLPHSPPKVPILSTHGSHSQNDCLPLTLMLPPSHMLMWPSPCLPPHPCSPDTYPHSRAPSLCPPHLHNTCNATCWLCRAALCWADSPATNPTTMPTQLLVLELVDISQALLYSLCHFASMTSSLHPSSSRFGSSTQLTIPCPACALWGEGTQSLLGIVCPPWAWLHHHPLPLLPGSG